MCHLDTMLQRLRSFTTVYCSLNMLPLGTFINLVTEMGLQLLELAQGISGAVRNDRAQLPVALAVDQAQLHGVVLEQGRALGDGDERDA